MSSWGKIKAEQYQWNVPIKSFYQSIFSVGSPVSYFQTRGILKTKSLHLHRKLTLWSPLLVNDCPTRSSTIPLRTTSKMPLLYNNAPVSCFPQGRGGGYWANPFMGYDKGYSPLRLGINNFMLPLGTEKVTYTTYCRTWRICSHSFAETSLEKRYPSFVFLFHKTKTKQWTICWKPLFNFEGLNGVDS